MIGQVIAHEVTHRVPAGLEVSRRGELKACLALEPRPPLRVDAHVNDLARVMGSAVAELEALVGDLHLVPVTDELVASASELAEDEGLRGYDAVHLAAALVVEATVFTSADAALCAAAARRGFHVADPLAT